MFENYVVLIKSNLNGLLRLARADEYDLSDGELLGFLDPQAFSSEDLCDMYSELTPNEDFEVEPLDYSGEDFNEAREIARQTHPGGWEPSDDRYVCYNGSCPFKAGGKWYSIYYYWVDILDI